MYIDFSFVDTINTYMTAKETKSEENFSHMFENLSSLCSFQKMINFYEHMFTIEEYKMALKCVLLNKDYKGSSEFANMLYNNLLRIKDLILINKKMAVYKHYDFSKMQSKLENSLPINHITEMTVYFVYDGINGGSILGDHEMMINFMLWPSDKVNLDAMEGVLLHEAHHLGMIETYTKLGLYTHGSKNKNIVKRLVIAIVTEGIATYLFNQSGCLSNLVVESHGKEFADIYRESENVQSHEIIKIIQKLNEDIATIREANDYETNVKYLEIYCCNYDGGQPLDKTIGVHICKVIDERLGRTRLIELLASPVTLIMQYNELINDKYQISITNHDI